MRKSGLLLSLLALLAFDTMAQEFGISAEIRPRFENRNGYQNLRATDVEGESFISQRSRINFDFKNESMKLYVSMQNTSVWGDKSTLAAQDNVAGGIGTTLHQAWVEAKLADKLSLKLGRQEIVYDDHRIFGSVGWAQQARSHDAFIFKYLANDKHRVDLGFALNSNSQAGVDYLYDDVAGYKNFQYAWYHGKFNDVGLSILALNRGKEYEKDGKNVISYMQTIGPRVTYKKNKLDANAAVYFQTGKEKEIKVNALYYTANAGYKISDGFKVGLGYEYLSGKDQDATTTDINTFQPLFGTNHKFNGWMDYFYVGYGNPTGLQDINATFAYKNGKFSAKLIPHLFSATADVYDGTEKMNAALGTEIDLVLGYSIAKDIKLNVGYSQMMATETMEVIKGGDKDENNSWSWVMFTFKPQLFSSKKATK